MSGKRYTDEFKIEAVKQVTDRRFAGPTGKRPIPVSRRLRCRADPRAIRRVA